MKPRDGNRRRGLSADERALWKTVTKAIAPLRDMPAVDADEEGAVEAPSPQKKRAERPVARRPEPPAPTAPPLTPLDRRMRARVARGKESIDARLDLHGLTQSEAHDALLRFLRSASGRGAKLVLVITGKGMRADAGGERGVLRRQVPHWLRLPEFRAFVIGFEAAHVAHGGEGALYVRVRRARD